MRQQACGKPVIAYGRGGALETVIGVYADDETPGRFDPVAWEEGAPVPEQERIKPSEMTGVFFRRQNVESLAHAISYLHKVEDRFDPEFIRRHALSFGREHFRDRIRSHILTRYERFREELGLV